MRLAAVDLAHGPVVEPSSVLAYLRRGAWVKLDEHRHGGRHVVTLYEHQRQHVEVHVPVWSEALDYPRRLAEAINAIASAERRPALALLSELRAARADVVRVHTGDAPLPLTRALAVLSAVRALFTAAATELVSRPLGSGEPLPPRVDALLEGLTLDHAEPGSAIVRVLVPVSASAGSVASVEPASFAAEPGPRPLGRRLTEALVARVTAVGEAAQAAAAQGTIEPLVDQGVDAELCRALASAGAPFTLDVAWALTLPRTPGLAVTLTAEHMTALAEAAERLPPLSPRG